MAEERNSDPYAIPRSVTDIKDCAFYHTVEIPGQGLMQGFFDLREGAADYLGNVDFKNKRVLELGTASGFLCFYMESKGAEVVAYDLSENDLWDIVPHATADYEKYVRERREGAGKLNNGFWFSHRVFHSKARMVHGTVYTIPREIGMVDISTFGSILLHVRDPFLALQNALRLTKETVIITDVFNGIPARILGRLNIPAPLPNLPNPFKSPLMKFVPDNRQPSHADTWWLLSPEVVRRMISVLGFEKSDISYHWQRFGKTRMRLYTIVGHRTVENYSY
jgi:SAM-dependent methyltransferase